MNCETVKTTTVIHTDYQFGITEIMPYVKNDSFVV